MKLPLRKKLAAEAIGTFCLVFAGTCAVVVNGEGALSHVGVSLTFGLVVFAMIVSLGDVSGAHINPAVTCGFYFAGRLPASVVLPYVLSQFAGAIAASLGVQALFPSNHSLGATLPAGPMLQSWMLELFLTATLMLVILGVATGAKEKGVAAGLAVGGAVAMGALFGGPVSGASMNPARSLGPALVSGQWDTLWIYLTAPVVGALMAVFACRCIRDTDCCRSGALKSSR